MWLEEYFCWELCPSGFITKLLGSSGSFSGPLGADLYPAMCSLAPSLCSEFRMLHLRRVLLPQYHPAIARSWTCQDWEELNINSSWKKNFKNTFPSSLSPVFSLNWWSLIFRSQIPNLRFKALGDLATQFSYHQLAPYGIFIEWKLSEFFAAR